MAAVGRVHCPEGRAAVRAVVGKAEADLAVVLKEPVRVEARAEARGVAMAGVDMAEEVPEAAAMVKEVTVAAEKAEAVTEAAMAEAVTEAVMEAAMAEAVTEAVMEAVIVKEATEAAEKVKEATEAAEKVEAVPEAEVTEVVAMVKEATEAARAAAVRVAETSSTGGVVAAPQRVPTSPRCSPAATAAS